MSKSTGLVKNLRDDALVAWDAEQQKMADERAVEDARQRQSVRDALAGAILLTLGVVAPTDEMAESGAGSIYWDHDGLRFVVDTEAGLYVTDTASKDGATIESLADLGYFLTTHPQK